MSDTPITKTLLAPRCSAGLMGATHTVNVDREDPMATIREITGWKMADVVFEAVGHQTETLALSMNLVRQQGTVVAFGVPDELFYDGFLDLLYF